jgi:hypothetical protein
MIVDELELFKVLVCLFKMLLDDLSLGCFDDFIGSPNGSAKYHVGNKE